MSDMMNELDESPRKGLQFERGFWRHPVTRAAMLVMPDGKSKQLRSPSGDFKNHLDETTNLEKWLQRQIVEGMLLMVPDNVPILPDDEKARRHVLDGVIVEALELAKANLAADRGTHTHLLSEMNDEGASWLSIAVQGEDLGIGTAEQQALVDAWNKLLDHYDLEIITSEVTVANDIAAGTLDRTARCRRDLEFTRLDGSRVFIPAGTVLVLDVKTGGLRVGRKGEPLYWNGYRHQIGHYANSRPVFIDPDDPKGNVWHDWPEGEAPSTEHALIAHLDVASAIENGVATARMVYVDLVDYDAMTETIGSVRYWRTVVPFSSCDDVPDVTVDVEDAVPYAEVMDWLQHRIDVIGKHEQARRLLSAHWPADVVPPKDGMLIANVEEIVGLLDRVEREVGLPFGESDPRAPRSGHKSEASNRRPVASNQEIDQ